MKFGLKSITLILVCAGMTALAQTSGLSLGGGNHDTSLPVEVTADSLSVDQASNAATFEGTARVGQGSLRLGADKIVVNYDQVGGQIVSVQATGNVVFTNGVDMAEAGTAIYRVSSGLLSMSGNVLLVQGTSAISGDQLDLNILANSAKVTGNVKTVLAPK
jgi:lipopolysaccharide export system protein LptA